MKVKVKAKKVKKVSGDVFERLDLLIACGHPVFIISGMVCWPAEADLFFTEEEMNELEDYIRANS